MPSRDEWVVSQRVRGEAMQESDLCTEVKSAASASVERPLCHHPSFFVTTTATRLTSHSCHHHDSDPDGFADHI